MDASAPDDQDAAHQPDRTWASPPIWLAARRVLTAEAAALVPLADHLGDEFPQALDLLTRAEGRPRHRHRTWARAAMSAARSPPPSPRPARRRSYVHPAEASHGDLGMVTGVDAVLALSNSGETAELTDIVTYTHDLQGRHR